MGLDLNSRNYWKVTLLNLKKNFVWLMTHFFAIHRHNFFCYYNRHIIIKKFQKLSIFKIECSSSDIWSNIKLLPPWSCCFFFKLSKYVNVVVLLLLFFFCFLTATNALTTSWVTFSKTSVIFVFFLRSDLIFPW